MNETSGISQLPVITGKPWKPARNPKRGVDVACTKADCWENIQADREKRVREPHTHPASPPRNGTGWLERKASGEVVYNAPWVKAVKPFKMTEAKARVETAAKALARMQKECVTPEDKYCATVIGRVTPQGYVVHATNGHWALLVRGDGKVKCENKWGDYMDVGDKHQGTVVASSELWNALKRARVMMNDRSQCVTLQADKAAGRIALYSSDAYKGEFSECVPAQVSCNWSAGFNADYIETCLGAWPLTFWVQEKDSLSAVIVEPADRSWRYVVMPIRTELDLPEPYVEETEEVAEWD